MKQANPAPDDMFEKARKAFFETSKAPANPNVSPAKSGNPLIEGSPKQAAPPSPGKQS